jgi:hypothetical protein
LTVVALLGCGLLAACGSTRQPSGTATGTASGESADKTRDFEFAQCMRSHGVSNFPDPTPGGGIDLPPNVNPDSPAFRSARETCRQYLPNRAGPVATSASDRAAALALSRCMRTHGVPQFPDPAFTSAQNAPRVLVLRGMVFAIPASVNPKSPAFRRAARACGIGPP